MYDATLILIAYLVLKKGYDSTRGLVLGDSMVSLRLSTYAVPGTDIMCGAISYSR